MRKRHRKETSENSAVKEMSAQSYHLPWPKELSQGLMPGLLWAVTSFVMLIIDVRLGTLTIAGMLFFFYAMRKTPFGRARRHYVQGRIAYRDGKLQEALDCFVKALAIMPNAKDIYPVVGDLHFHFGDLAAAKNAYQQYFLRNSTDDNTRIWYAGKFMERGMFPEAVRELKKLPAESRREDQVVNVLGVCYLRMNQAAEAVQVLSPLAARKPGLAELELSARYLLAKAYIQLRETEKARNVLRQLEEDRPGFENVRQLLAELK